MGQSKYSPKEKYFSDPLRVAPADSSAISTTTSDLIGNISAKNGKKGK
jgi:hypothetical protein